MATELETIALMLRNQMMVVDALAAKFNADQVALLALSAEIEAANDIVASLRSQLIKRATQAPIEEVIV